jgi:hypothetical protein
MNKSKLPTPAQLNNNSKDTKLEAIRGAVRQNERLARRVSPRTSMVNNNNANLVLGEGDAFDETGTNPFTGVAIVHPGHTDDNGTWNIFGKNAGTLQFGLSATDGKAYAGAGAVIQDENGISIICGSDPDSPTPQKSIKFVDASGNIVSHYFSAIDTAANDTTVRILCLNPSAYSDHTVNIALEVDSTGGNGILLVQSDPGGGTSCYTACDNITLEGATIYLGGIDAAVTIGGNLSADGNIKANGFFNLGTVNAQTISGGVITVTGGRCVVDTQGGAATDDLDTINGGADGDLLVIYTANSGRDVTAKDGTGNLALAGDFVMTNIRDRLVLLKDSGTWVELSRSDNQ